MASSLLRSQKWPTAVLVMTCALTVAGCASGTASTQAQPGPPVLGPVPTITNGDQIILPLDSYDVTSAQSRTIAAAAFKVTDTCMRKFGFTYHGVLPSQGVPGDPKRYGLLDLASAKKFGYKDGASSSEDPGQTAATKEQQDDQDSGSTTAAYQNVLQGVGPSAINGVQVPTGGCLALGQNEFPTNISSGTGQQVQEIALGLYNESMQDSRAQAVEAKWSACMEKHGFDYRTPDDAIGDQAWASTSSASRQEINTATADVECKISTNLAGEIMAIETAYQNQYIRQNVEAMAAAKNSLRTLLSDAAQVVGPAKK